MNMDRWMKSGAAVAILVVALAGCSGNEAAKTAAPVDLIVTNSQTLQKIDLAGGTTCNQAVGTIQMRSILKNPTQISDQRFNDVRVTSYRVSYVRTDGGTQVPAS